MSGYRVSSCLITVPDELEREWRDLELRSDCSYFQSWGWVGVWLEQLARDLQPLAVRVWHGDVLVGMGVFLQRNIRRRWLVHSNALLLHEYPFDGRDMTIEYNGLLADREHVPGVYAQVISHLFESSQQCDEFFFSAIDADTDMAIRSAGREILAGDGRYIRLEESTVRTVDLDRIGAGVEGYLDGLSKNRRAQVRRSLRLYEAAGVLQLAEAETIDQAMEYLERLKFLHTRRWQVKGKSGVFSNPLWERFHRAVIRGGFPAGEVQLLKVTSGSRELGYLYNLIWRRHVYVLQTGFETVADKRMMPGYVVHALAVAHNKDKGMALYDLMHGDALYKRMLCNHDSQLRWVVLQRRRYKFTLEDLAVTVVRYCRSLRV